jgi:hypothetical protein
MRLSLLLFNKGETVVSILAAFMLSAPGMIALHFHRLLSRCQHYDALSWVGAYTLYNFIILLSTYGIMYATRRERIVSFLPFPDTNVVSGIFYAGFVAKFMAISFLSAALLPLLWRVCALLIQYGMRYTWPSVSEKVVDMLHCTPDDDSFIK